MLIREKGKPSVVDYSQSRPTDPNRWARISLLSGYVWMLGSCALGSAVVDRIDRTRHLPETAVISAMLVPALMCWACSIFLTISQGPFEYGACPKYSGRQLALIIIAICNIVFFIALVFLFSQIED